MARWLSGLNPEQRAAVEAVEGPVLVLAGAGSGKTRVITHRIAHLIDLGVAPENILGVTFTNKAAEEMRARLGGMVGKLAARVTLSTFHALGVLMLRAEGARKKRPERFTIFDEGDRLACLKQIACRVKLGRSFDLGAVAARLSAFKNAFLEPSDAAVNDDPYAEAAALFYPLYQEALRAFRAYDFDDLVCEPTRMMERDPACQARWADRFRYVLVDEYQDTNSAQLRMLRGLAGLHRNLCVVGDDDQAIYAWRGAEVRHILSFEADFPGARVIRLQQNYRSVGRVLALANAVIARAERRRPKTLLTTREDGPAVRLVVSEDGEAESAWIAEQIGAALSAKVRRPSEIAVLYRSNTLARGLEGALRAARLPYRLHGGKSFFDRKEVRDLAAYLRLAVNPSDEVSLRRVINSPPRGIGPRTLERLEAFAERQGCTLAEAVGRAEEALEQGDRALSPLKEFEATLARLRAHSRQGRKLHEALARLIDDIGLRAAIQKENPSPKAQKLRLELLDEFKADLEAYESRSARPSLAEFLQRRELVQREADDAEEPGERVTLSTLHGAKGLEFPLVFLAGMEEGLLPHDRVLHPHAQDVAGSDLDEERRLLYVGITRARDELILTRAGARLLNGKPRPRSLSQFLCDLPEGLFAVEDRLRPLEADDSLRRLREIKALLSGS